MIEKEVFPQKNSHIQEDSRAILVGALLPHERKPLWGNSPLDELRALAKTAEIEGVKEVIQHIHEVNPTYYLGKGRAEELAELAGELAIKMIIFDHDLSPSQIKNLEKLTGCRIMDRTELILGIFASHAKTRQATLQVQLAQMEYMLPRLKRMWSHLSRIDGQFWSKGPGEKQIEMDRRMVRKKIVDLRRLLKAIQKRKEFEVQSRREFFTISLVGYTNAGKSTLMNRLTGANVLVEDKLFATLDTRTRLWKLTPSKKALLSDTVGFISKIPAHLIASFHATLEEVTQADLLLHVVDLSHWAPQDQIEEVDRVLKTLGCQDKKTLLVLNKWDLLSDPIELNLLKERYPQHVVVSAREGIGMEELVKKVVEIASEEDEEMEITTDIANGRLLSFLFENTLILDRAYEGQEARFHLKIENRFKKRLEELLQ